jgi:hypothetical protein
MRKPIQVPQRQSAFPPRAQRNVFRRRDVRRQSRSFARWNQSLRRSPNSSRRRFPPVFQKDDKKRCERHLFRRDWRNPHAFIWRFAPDFPHYISGKEFKKMKTFIVYDLDSQMPVAVGEQVSAETAP